jgi:hypothetical protein
MYEPTAVGAATPAHVHIERTLGLGGSHMSRNEFSAKRAVLGLGTAAVGAAFAAFVSMGTAQAQVSYATNSDDGWEVVFGHPGEQGLAAGQGATNLANDTTLFDESPSNAAAFTNIATEFESAATGGGDHALEETINALDPSAYVVNVDPNFDGYLAGGGYLVPDDSLGYLGTELDLFLLSPLGLDPALLSPILDTLLGSPTF